MRIVCFALVSFLFLTSLQAFEARVLIDESENKKTLTGTLSVLCKASGGQSCSSSQIRLYPGTWVVERAKGRIKLSNGEKKKVHWIKGNHFVFSGSFSLENQILNKLSLHIDSQKAMWVIHLPVDQYLYGVLAAEVPSSWPIESLKAQAIASRTYFLFKKQQRKKEFFDVRSDTLDQVFKMDAKKHKNIVKAVNETHDQLLTTKITGAIFPAYFHADCGGGTSQEKVVWRKPSSLNIEVKDPYCQSASKNNWSFQVDKTTLTNLLKKAFFLPIGATLTSVLPRVGERSRARFVDFVFSHNIIKRLEANEFRRLLGFANLRSTRFSVKNNWNSIEFEGRGFGHGVGLCQWGAQRWARNGKNFKEILNHYYPNSKLETISSKTMKSLHAEAH